MSTDPALSNQRERWSEARPGAIIGTGWPHWIGHGDAGTSARQPGSCPLLMLVSPTMVDGAIKNALVCIDKNGNGLCDGGQVQDSTGASGNVTLAVPNADHGPVMAACSMSALADQPAVVSPLTTLVQQIVASTGASSAVPGLHQGHGPE